MESQSLLLCFLLFVATATFTVGRTGGVGGWTPIKNLSDPHVQEIAQFAVKENNSRSKTDMKLEKVARGETQVVAGVNYRLVLEVSGGASQRYEAVVWEKPGGKSMNLTSFNPVN